MNISPRPIFRGAALALLLPLALSSWAQQPDASEETESTSRAVEAQPASPGAPRTPAEPVDSAPPGSRESAAPIPPASPRASDTASGGRQDEAPAGGQPEEEDRSTLRAIDQIEEPVEAAGPRPRSRPEPRVHGARDDFPFGNHVVPPGGRVREIVSLFGSTRVEGRVDSDAVAIGGSTVISPGGRVGGDAVAIFGRIESQGEIRGEAVSVLGAISGLGGSVINGPVGGQVVSVLGNMELGPNAVVDGDIVVVGGRLTRDANAIVRGSEVGLPALSSFGDFDWFRAWLRRCVYYGRPLAFGPNLGWAWAVAFSFLAFYLVVTLLFPRGVVKCVEILETRPGYSILSSVLTVMLTPVAIVLLAATIVGALLIPFVGGGLLFAKLFGKAVMLAWIGRRITRFFGDGPFAHPAAAVLFGGLIVLLVYTVPVLGFLSYKLLSWLGLGVVVYAIVLAINREKSGPWTSAPLPAPAPVYPSTPYASATPAAPAGSEPPAGVSSGVAAAPMMSAGFSEMRAEGPAGSGGPESSVPPEPPAMGEAAVPEAPPAPPFSASASPPPPPTPPPPMLPPPAPPGSFGLPQPAAAAAAGWPRAGFFIRLGALAIDGVLIGLIMAFISGLLPRFLEFNDGPGGWLMALAIYGAIMWKHKGTTIGGIVCGLKVVRVDHRELDWATAVVRALACFLSLAVAGLGFIWVAIDEEKQSWHDKIAGTAVVLVPKGVSLV